VDQDDVIGGGWVGSVFGGHRVLLIKGSDGLP